MFNTTTGKLYPLHPLVSKYVEQSVSEYTKDNQIPYFSGAYSSAEVMSFLTPSKKVSISQPAIDESYNESLEPHHYPYAKGFGQKQNVASFEFECPTDTTSKFIDLRLIIFEPNLAEKIEHIKIGIYREDKPNHSTQISEHYFSARQGLNKFRIRNYLLQKNYTLAIGYQLKTEMNKEFPTWVTERCRSSAK